MGKAQKLLNAQRKICFTEIEQKYEENYSDDDDEEVTVENENESCDIVFDTALTLRELLFKYVENNGCSLCEYLDEDNTYNFIDWVVNN